MENKKCACKNGGCGKNRTPDRITIETENGEITNRELVCRGCAYKKRGDTLSCLFYESKPETVLKGGKCSAFLGEIIKNEHSCDCGEHGCTDCGTCGEHGCSDCGGCEK